MRCFKFRRFAETSINLFVCACMFIPRRKQRGQRQTSTRRQCEHLLNSSVLQRIYGASLLVLAPGSDWDLRLLLEHRKTLALDSGLPARLVFLPFINFQRARRLFLCLV